jgi:outer membrane lipopolysaccharide assembly protein LptE/RlpB
MQNKLSLIVVLFALVVLTTTSSCGYHLSGSGGIVPEGAKTIAVPVFLNGTNEPFVDVELTKAVVEEFLTDGRLKVVNLEGADLILRCKITKFDLTPVAYTATTYVQSYNVSINVNVSLEEAKTGKLLFQDKGLGSIFFASYPVTLGDISATKTAKETAIKNASRDLASSIRSRVLEGF